MSKQEIEIGASDASEQLIDPELQPLWAEFPKLIPEVPVLRLDRNTSVIEGFRQSLILRGAGISERLRKLMSRLDGTTSIQQLMDDSSGKNADFRMLTALIRSGAIESNMESQLQSLSIGASNFVSRTSQITGWNRSKTDVTARNHLVKISVLGEKEFGSAMVELLIESGIENVDVLHSDSLSPEYLICDQSLLNQLTAIPKNVSNSCTVIYCSLGRDKCQIGPAFSYGELDRFKHALDVETSADSDTGLFTPFIAHIIYGYVSRLVDFPLHRKAYKLDWNCDSGFRLNQLVIGDVAVYKANGISPKVVEINSGSIFDELLATIEMPAKREIAPVAHLWHYDEKNILLARSFPHPLSSSYRFALIDIEPPMAMENIDERITTSGLLSGLLFYCGGLYSEGSEKRRVSPSGGNIGAVEIFISFPEGSFLESSLYRYEANGHVLEKLEVQNTDQILSKSITLYLVGNTNKIESKYGAYAFHLMMYDCGVVIEYLSKACELLGVGASDFSNDCSSLPANIPSTTNSYRLVGSLKLDIEQDRGQEIESLIERDTSFRNTIFSRYACRTFETGKLDDAILVFQATCKHMKEMTSASRKSIIPEFLLLVTGCDDSENGIYELDGNAVSKVSEFVSDFDPSLLMNQSTLGLSPFKIVPWLSKIGTERFLDPQLIPETLQETARAITHGWLVLPEFGFSGTAAGGAIRSEMEKILPPSFSGGTPLLTLCFGNSQ